MNDQPKMRYEIRSCSPCVGRERPDIVIARADEYRNAIAIEKALKEWYVSTAIWDTKHNEYA